MKRIVVKRVQAGQRFDLVASSWLNLTRSQVARHIRSGEITLNGFKVKAGELVKLGDHLAYQPVTQNIKPPKVPIIYENADLLIVDKPAGLSVHPTGRSGQTATLVDFVKSQTLDPDPLRPGIVHRLDKDTSGLLVVAKTVKAKQYLQQLFAARKVEKEYLALVVGIMPQRRAEINLPIGAGSGVRRRVDPAGRGARTRYEVITQYHHSSLVQAWPASGRTHQIRVHFAAIGHPIVGDSMYGQADPDLGRQFLHAHKLAFIAPSGQRLELTSPLPKDLQDYLKTHQ